MLHLLSLAWPSIAWAQEADRPAEVIELLQPDWPEGLEGTEPFEVEAFVHVEADGHATAVFLVDELPTAFRIQAREALLASRYAPAIVGGAPVAADVRVQVGFTPPPPGPTMILVPAEEIVVTADPTHPTADRGVGDERIVVGDVQAVQTLDAADALELAPSVFVTRTGSDLNPPQIFLRGFDARHGQDLAFDIDGIPLNQVGNPHGHGLVNPTFVPPEALKSLRVVEGPFDPAQGDFAVAGSASFELGLAEPGMLFRLQGGSFETGRAVVGWQHAEDAGTFVVGDLMQTAGYGENRAGREGGVLARVEGGAHGPRFFAVAGAYGSAYDFAGVVRKVDVDEGRVDGFDTQDPNQGGSFEQAFVGGGVHDRDGDTAWRVRANAAMRRSRLRTNLTGFLTDDRRAGESQHDQRGDLTEQAYGGATIALDADVEQTFDGGLLPTLRAGVDGRYDDVDGTSWRVRDLDQAPYRVEADYALRQSHAGLHGEGEIAGGIWTLRAGGRLDAFVYDLVDHCGAKDSWFPGIELDDVNCPDESRNGPRLRSEARTAHGMIASPRGSFLLRPWPEHTLSVAAGRGFRSIEALALSEDESSPVGSLWGAEVGWRWTRATEAYTAVHTVAAYSTQVQRDLIFDEAEVANVVAGETARYGASAVSQVEVGPFVERTTVTYTYAVFGDDLAPSYSSFATDRQPGQLIPYVPPWVVRSDLSVGGRVGGDGFDLDRARVGVGLDYLSPRPLPQSERSSPVFTVDVQGSVREGPVELALAVTNVLDARYPLAEYNFASWFPDASGEPFPTRIASRQIAPGPPRAVLATFTFTPGAP